MSETSLYRHFNSKGNLLYVGISKNPIKRLSQHEKTSHWSRQITKIEIEWFETHEQALEAERKTIRSKRPKYNVMHKIDHSAEIKQPEPLAIPTEKAIKHFGSAANLARELEISRQAITLWGEYMPELRAYEIKYNFPRDFKALTQNRAA